MTRIDDLPGFRRRFLVSPGRGHVRAALEDDYHHMAVTLHHDGRVVQRVDAALHRAPWSTCPGAPAQLVETFTGVALADVAARGDKPLNCTHLHDLATLAAAHAGDTAPLVYDVLRADPVEGLVAAELRRDGETLLAWTLAGFTIVAPEDAAGTGLFAIKPLLARADAAGQEAIRIFRWAILVGHGREIPLADQSDATRMPPNCFTFQPERRSVAKRVGRIRDFTAEGGAPLDGPATI